MEKLPAFKSGAARRVSGYVSPIPELSIPVHVIEGEGPGPVLLVTGGVHGAEFCSIEAALRLANTDLSHIRGTLVVLPLLNTSAFKARSAAVMPEDGKNLNRAFPGRHDGTASERLAAWLVADVFPNVDAYLDLHGGDITEEIEPLTIYPIGSEGSRKLAVAFGLPMIAESKNAGSTVAGAARLGVPSAMIEIGGNGLRAEANLAKFDEGFRRVMAHLGMAEADLPPASEQHVRQVALKSASATTEGIWYPAKGLMETVAAGEVIGEIRDALGNVRETVRSEVDGIVCYRLTALSVNANETLFGIGQTPERAS